jgi:hypothetical protein
LKALRREWALSCGSPTLWNYVEKEAVVMVDDCERDQVSRMLGEGTVARSSASRDQAS